jgi:hypothetical protein
MLNTLLALIIELSTRAEELTKEEASQLVKKINNATLPSDFESAHKQVKKFLAHLEEEF